METYIVVLLSFHSQGGPIFNVMCWRPMMSQKDSQDSVDRLSDLYFFLWKP